MVGLTAAPPPTPRRPAERHWALRAQGLGPPWGMREMLVTDFDEHVLRFGHGIDEAPQPVTRAEGGD